MAVAVATGPSCRGGRGGTSRSVWGRRAGCRAASPVGPACRAPPSAAGGCRARDSPTSPADLAAPCGPPGHPQPHNTINTLKKKKN